MYLYLSGWCHPCMQNCRAQLDCRREKEREAQDRTHVYCLQDEAARKDKAGIQSSTHRCHFKSQKSQPGAQQHWFPHHGTHQAGPRSSCTAKSHCATQPPPRSLPWVTSWQHPGCAVHPQAPCLGSEEERAGPPVLISALPAGFPSAKHLPCCLTVSF